MQSIIKKELYVIILFCIINYRKGESRYWNEFQWKFEFRCCEKVVGFRCPRIRVNSIGRISLILVRNRIARLLVLCINEEHSKASSVSITWSFVPLRDEKSRETFPRRLIVEFYVIDLTWPDYISRIIATIVVSKLCAITISNLYLQLNWFCN